MSIFRSAVNKPVTTFLIFLAFAILGVFSLTRLPIDFFPDIESNTIMVMSAYPGASAEDVENNLTKVLENALNGVADLKDLNSQSKENLAFLTLTFKYGIDIESATNDVRDKLDMVNSNLPDGASTPVIFKFSADDMPISSSSLRCPITDRSLRLRSCPVPPFTVNGRRQGWAQPPLFPLLEPSIALK